MKITDLPFNRLLGIAHAPQEGALLMLPNDVRYTNHLGTVHASALLSLAEASSGEFLIRRSSAVDFAILPVVRRLESKFRKPALGAVHSKIAIDEATVETFLATLKTKGRAQLEIPVDVYDERGEHALRATIEWFVARQD